MPEQPAKLNIFQYLGRKILDQWVTTGVLVISGGVIAFFYGSIKTVINNQIDDHIQAFFVRQIDNAQSPLHHTLTDFVSNEIQGTVGASTKQSFELGSERNVYYIPTYVPKRHNVLIFVDFSQVGNEPKPSQVLLAIDGISQRIATDRQQIFEPNGLIQKARMARATSPANLLGPPPTALGELDKIPPDIFTIQFQLLPEDVNKKIFIKVIVFVVNPIWVTNKPQM